jgi:hypothetical protein
VRGAPPDYLRRSTWNSIPRGKRRAGSGEKGGAEMCLADPTRGHNAAPTTLHPGAAPTTAHRLLGDERLQPLLHCCRAVRPAAAAAGLQNGAARASGSCGRGWGDGRGRCAQPSHLGGEGCRVRALHAPSGCGALQCTPRPGCMPVKSLLVAA